MARVGREKYSLLPTKLPRPFSHSHLSEGRPHNLSVWKSLYFSRVLNEHFCFRDTALTRTMLLLSSDILQRESPSHIYLYTIYVGRGCKVVLEEKLRKYGLEFKQVKSRTRILLSAIHVHAKISIVLINSYQVSVICP